MYHYTKLGIFQQATTNGPTTTNGQSGAGDVGSEEMTSKDYYFDSYAHFGIHEVHESCHLFFFVYFSFILKISCE